MRVDIRDNAADILRDLTKLERKVLPQATNRSLNRIGQTANTLITRSVAKEAGVTQALLRQRGFMVKVKSKISTLTFTIIVRWGAIPMKDFNPRETKKGVTAKAWGQRKVYEGAFIVDSLGRHVFVRKTDKRLPIKKLYGPIPARLADTDDVQGKIDAMLAERLPRELTSNINFYASKELKGAMKGRSSAFG